MTPNYRDTNSLFISKPSCGDVAIPETIKIGVAISFHGIRVSKDDLTERDESRV
jgi:hypothetical protein